MKHYFYSKPSCSLKTRLQKSDKIIFDYCSAAVYLITCVDSKIYVGSTKQLTERINQHKNMNRNICIDNSNYTMDTFQCKVLEYINYDEHNYTNAYDFRAYVRHRERYWQDFYDVLNDNAHNLEKSKSFDKCKEYRKQSSDLRVSRGREGQQNRSIE